jgi:uncharacterized protein (TIGR02996 family)
MAKKSALSWLRDQLRGQHEAPPPPPHPVWPSEISLEEQYPTLRRNLLERIFRSQYRHNYILRGSVVLQHWFGTTARVPNDIDLVAKYPHDPERCTREIFEICQDRSLGPNLFPITDRNVLPMWEYDIFPGIRFHVPCAQRLSTTVQLDVAFDNVPKLPNERLELKPIPDQPGVFVQAWTRESCLASKLCWIANDSADGTAAAIDDIADALLLLERGEINSEILRQLIPAILSEQKHDLSVFGNYDDRLVSAMEAKAILDPHMSYSGMIPELVVRYGDVNLLRNALLLQMQRSLGSILDGLVWVPTTEEWAFLHQMARNRTDRLTPLVYADWLDEQSDPRGELLRLHVHESSGQKQTVLQTKRRTELKPLVPSRWLTLAGIG